MRYAREVGVKKPWGATDKVAGQSPLFSGQKSPEKRPENDPKNNPEKGVLFCLWGKSAFYLGWERVCGRLKRDAP